MNAPRPFGETIAVVVARAGALPVGADEAAAEAGGRALVLGDGARAAAGELLAATRTWWSETGPALRCAALAAVLAEVLRDTQLVVLPASPDGRDLAPRLAAILDRPLLAGAIRVRSDGGRVSAELARLDDRVVARAVVEGPAVATLAPGARSAVAAAVREAPVPLVLGDLPACHDAELIELLPPDPRTMDLADAPRVFGGGAGLAPSGTTAGDARATFALLEPVAGELGASAGATRVVTDAGWIAAERQIGTTGVLIDPDLYVALGVSGATQHVGGIGNPRYVVSVNTDPACPMSASADLSIVADAPAVLAALAARLGVDARG